MVMQQPALRAKKPDDLQQDGCYQNHHHDQVCRLHGHVEIEIWRCYRAKRAAAWGRLAERGGHRCSFAPLHGVSTCTSPRKHEQTSHLWFCQSQCNHHHP